MGVSDCRERAYKAHSSKKSRLSASRRRHGRRRAAVEGRLFLAQTFDSHASMGFVVVDRNGYAAQEPGWESLRADHASHVGPLMLAPWGDVGPGPRRRCLLIELSRCMGNMGNAPPLQGSTVACCFRGLAGGFLDEKLKSIPEESVDVESGLTKFLQ